MSRVRALKQSDIPQIVELNDKLFPSASGVSAERQARIFHEVCFASPWTDPEITSLVFEEEGGRISGFLGVIMRPMSYNGRRLRAAIFQHLMVDRSTLASLQLFRKLLEGPQDVSMGENAVEVVHQLWTRLGHPSSLLNSIYWRRFLRPASVAARLLSKRRAMRALSPVIRPVCSAADRALAHLSVNPLRMPAGSSASGDDEELTADVMLQALPSMMESCLLTPVYTQQSLAWLLSVLEGERRNGVLRKKLVRTERGEVAGWYIYYVRHDGPSVVFQIAAQEKTAGMVLDHLFAHAYRHGASELTGRLEPRFMKTLREKRCYFMPGRNWMLVHAKCPEYLHAIDAGRAFLSRLEGDLWVL